jgi:hypothetical protein
MVRRAWDSPVNALAEEVLDAAKDERGVVDGIDLDSCQRN